MRNEQKTNQLSEARAGKINQSLRHSLEKEGRIFTHLHALNLELHMIFSGGLAVLSLLPTVAVSTITNLFPRIKQHRTTLGSIKSESEDSQLCVSKFMASSEQEQRLKI